MIKNIYFTYCLIPIIIAKTEIVQHEVYIVANIVPDVRPGCLYRSAKAATIGSSLTQGFAVLRAAFYHWQQVLSPLSIFIMFLEEAMQELKDRIVKEGKILPGNIVKVDGFLNHRVDCAFMGRIADEFKKYFDLDNVDLILTAEASGIALSAICAYRYGKPMVYAKKAKSDNIEGGLYQSEIFSYTYKKKVTLLVSKEWIHPGDRVLVIDDFLARGEALRGLCEIVQAAGAELVGIRRIQQPDKAAVPGGLWHQLAQALVAAAGRRDPGNGLTFEVSLLFQLTGTVNQTAKAHIDADGADAILIHGIQQTVDKAVVAAVRALQSLLRVGKKVLLLLLFSQCGTHIHIVAQLAEAAAANVPHCAVCQRHGKAACAVVIHSQSVHSLSC